MLQAMNFYFLLPIAIGISIVLQGSFNRDMAVNFGLATTVLLNAAVFFFASVAFYAWVRLAPQYFPVFIQTRTTDTPFHWLYLLPGLFGLVIVVGVPWSLERIGPSNTFLFLIITQIVLSVAMEAYDLQASPAIMKLAGAALVVLGGILAARA